MPVRCFGERDLELVRQVLESGQLSCLGGGQFTARFEAAFAQAHGAKHGVAMNGAMSILHASIMAAGAGAGDEVLCDPVCVFGAVATMYNNAVPVFVDINPVTLNMDPDLIEARISERTKALIVTHVFGLPAEIDRIVEIAHRHGLLVIEDCAHAILTRFKGRYVGTYGDIGSFSFQASKQLGLGDGGMAVTSDPELAKALALHGGAPSFHSVAYGLHYNYRMTEPIAAIGLAQLEKAQGYIDELRRNARCYDAAVEDCPWIVIQRGPEEAEHSYHLWGAVIDEDAAPCSRADLAEAMQDEGCGINMGYTNVPAYEHPLIRDRMGYGKGCPLDCPLYTGRANVYPQGTCPVTEKTMPNILMAYPFRPWEECEAEAAALRRAIERVS